MDKTVSFYLAYIYKSFLEFTQERLKRIDVSYGQLPFIVYIGKFSGCSAKDVREALGADWGHTQRVIDKLISQGIIIKSVDELDKRVYHLSLTAKGMEAFKIAHEVFKDWDKEKLTSLKDNERDELFRLLSKLSGYKDNRNEN